MTSSLLQVPPRGECGLGRARRRTKNGAPPLARNCLQTVVCEEPDGADYPGSRTGLRAPSVSAAPAARPRPATGPKSMTRPPSRSRQTRRVGRRETRQSGRPVRSSSPRERDRANSTSWGAAAFRLAIQQHAFQPVTARAAATIQPGADDCAARSRFQRQVADPRRSAVAQSSSSMRASAMSCSRFARILAQAALEERADRRGVSAGSADQSGSRSRMRAKVSDDRVARRTRGGPASISNSTHPNAQMSVRLSTACPRACSGLM